jgi:hypothetical protein
MVAIDMEMPKGCFECERGSICGYGLGYRPDSCPLVEIVTCKDCKHWHNDGIMTTCDKNIGNGFPKDHYCADAERRE